MQKNDEIKRLCRNIRISFARGLCHLSYFIILEVTYRSILWELNGILSNKFHCINVKSFEHNIKNLLQIPHVVASPPTARQQQPKDQWISGKQMGDVLSNRFINSLMSQQGLCDDCIWREKWHWEMIFQLSDLGTNSPRILGKQFWKRHSAAGGSLHSSTLTSLDPDTWSTQPHHLPCPKS